MTEPESRTGSWPSLNSSIGVLLEPPSGRVRTVAALVVVALTIAAAAATSQVASVTSYSLVVAGMALVTWYGGLRLGLGAIVVAAAVTWVFIVKPGGLLPAHAADLEQFVLGLAGAVAVSYLVERLRKATLREATLAEERRSLLEDTVARERRLTTLTDALPPLISYVDAERKYRFNNQGYEQWFRRSRSEITGCQISEVLGEDAYRGIRPHVDEALSGRTVRFEALVPHAEGDPRWVQADFVPDILPDGRVQGFFAVFSDLTEPRRREQALAESEARARGILEAAQDAIVTADEGGVVRSFNTAAEQLFGYSAHEVIGRSAEMLMPPVYRAQHRTQIKRYLETGSSTMIGRGRDVTGLRKDGSTFPIRLAVSEVTLASGRLFTGIMHDLTERVRAEEDVRLSERRYRVLGEATTSIVWTADPLAQVVEPQPQWEAYTGQKWPEYEGTGFIQMVHPEDRQSHMERWRDALAVLKPQSFAARVWHAGSQSWRHCDTFAVPVKSESGDVIEWIGTTTDVEDRIQREALEHLRASDERTRVAESAARLGMWEWDLESGFVWSDGMAGVFGVRQSGAGKNETIDELLNLIHPDDRQRVVGAFDEARRNRHRLDTEYRVSSPEGGLRWLYARGSYLEASASGPARMVGVTMDITDQVEAREALARASAETANALALVDAVLDNTPTGVALFDKQMRWLRINAAGAETIGLAAEALVGRCLEEVLPGVGEVATARYREVWRSGLAMPPEEISGETPAQPGVLRWWDQSAVPVKDRSGRVQALAVIFNEVTERKRLEDALRRREQRERFLSQVTRGMMESLDQRNALNRVSHLAVPEFADVSAFVVFDQPQLDRLAWMATGREEEQDLLKRLEMRDWFARPGSSERMAQMLLLGNAAFMPSEEAVKRCAPSNALRKRAGQLGLRSLISVPLVLRSSTIGAAMFAMTHSGRNFDEADLALARDLAERVSIAVENVRLVRELQEAAENLRHANAAKDDFLGMVSHELKSPLTTIKGNASILQHSAQRMSDADRAQALDDVASSADRLDRLIDNMLVLARLEHGQRMEPEPSILPRIARRVVEEYRRKRPERPIKVNSRHAEMPVVAAAESVEQVVRNLLSNADKYSADREPIDINIWSRDGEVCLDVLDRGPGISAEEAERIFEPFYRSARTAGRAAGIGVGLALCKRVIEAQRGRLWAKPRRGGGSVFGFALPVYDSSGYEAPAEEESPEQTADGAPRLLRAVGNEG
jgi:PAS domain S-box-containing protein